MSGEQGDVSRETEKGKRGAFYSFAEKPGGCPHRCAINENAAGRSGGSLRTALVWGRLFAGFRGFSHAGALYIVLAYAKIDKIILYLYKKGRAP